jgi:hypothetical protein
MTSPDPIRDPQGYQQHLLGLLGDDDPAEVQAATPSAIRLLIEQAGERLTDVPEPGEWSAHGCIAHVIDAEIVMSGRYRFVLAHEEPPLIGYDQDLWVDALHAGGERLQEQFAFFEPLRLANVDLFQRASPEQRARVGVHAERGPESFDLAFRMIAGHDRFHLAQARAALA